jgi:superfamily II DNA or RNA helicase
VILADIVSRAVAKGKRVLVIAPRRKLIRQLYKTIDRRAATSITMGNDGIFERDRPIQLASADSLRNRLKRHGRKYLGEIDAILIDELHIQHGGALWKLLDEHYQDITYIGVTATPIDEYGYALPGWDAIVYPFQTEDMIAQGYLVPVECYAPVKPDLTKVKSQAGDYNLTDLSAAMNRKAITANAFEVWSKYARDKKTMVFCIDIAHAEAVREEFESHGIRTAIAHSQMDEEIEEEHMQAFADDRAQVLINVMKLTAGFDQPDIEALLLLRPTRSLRLYLQIIGRGLRISPETGKDQCLVLDCANCIETNGYPTERRDFTTPRPPGRRKAAPRPPAPKECDYCGRVIPPGQEQRQTEETDRYIQTTTRCPYCFEVLGVEHLDKVAVELKRLEEQRKEIVDVSAMTNQYSGYRELRKLGNKAGYKPGWAWRTAKMIEERNLWPLARQVFARVEALGLRPQEGVREILRATGDER